MSAPADCAVWRDATADDGGGLPHVRRHLPVVQAETAAPAVKRGRKVVERPALPPKAPHSRRGHTLSMRRLSKREMERLRLLYPDTGERMPATRGECPTERPCPWVRCTMHLALEVNEHNGNIKITYPRPDGEPDLAAMPETCALDVADRDGATLEAVAAALGITRERVRQLEAAALASFKSADPKAFAVCMELAGVGMPRPEGVTEADDGSGARSDREALDGLSEVVAGSVVGEVDTMEPVTLWEVA